MKKGVRKYPLSITLDDFLKIALTSKWPAGMIGQAIKLGLIKRRPCIICGLKGEGHHWDYNQP